MAKLNAKRIIKEEILTEGLLSGVLKVLGGALVTKGVAKGAIAQDLKQVAKDADLKKKAAAYVKAHEEYVAELEELEQQMGIEFPPDMKKLPSVSGK